MVRPAKHYWLLLFLFFLSVYLLFASGYVDSTDGQVLYATTRSIVERGVLHLTDLDVRREFMLEQHGPWPPYTRPGRGGNFYGKYGLGSAFFQVPFYFAGKIAAKRSKADADSATEFSCSLASSFVTAGSAFVIALLVSGLGFGRGVSFLTALLFGFGTIAWPYAKMSFTESAQGLFLLLTVFSLWKSSQNPNGKTWFFLSGIWFGVLLLIKASSLIFAPVFIIFLFAPGGERKFFRRTLVVLAGVLPFLALTLYLNFIRFGSPFESGFGKEALDFSTPFWEGFRGFLFSWRRGLIFYSPLSLVGLFAAGLLFKRAPRLAVSVVTLFFLNLFLYSKWHYWTGGRCWGPRFLVPTVPLLALPLAALLLTVKNSWKRTLPLLVIVIISFLIQVVAVLIPWHLPEGFRYAPGLTAQEREAFPPQLYSAFVVLDHLIFEKSDTYALSDFGILSDKTVRLSGKDFDRFNLWYLRAFPEGDRRRLLAPTILGALSIFFLFGVLSSLTESTRRNRQGHSILE